MTSHNLHTSTTPWLPDPTKRVVYQHPWWIEHERTDLKESYRKGPRPNCSIKIGFFRTRFSRPDKVHKTRRLERTCLRHRPVVRCGKELNTTSPSLRIKITGSRVWVRIEKSLKTLTPWRDGVRVRCLKSSYRDPSHELLTPQLVSGHRHSRVGNPNS